MSLTEAEELELLFLLEQEAAESDIVEWIRANQIVNEKGDPIEFERHRFLVDIYRDESPKLCVMKCSQVGLSTAAILKEFYMAAKRGFNCIHTLPTDDDVRAFVRSKVNPIIERNPAIREKLIGSTDNIYHKQVGESFIFWQGTKGESKGIMITSDLNFHDELDRSDIGKVETYHSRLAHSQFKGEWFFSNPSRPNVGVDVYWQMSDKKRWHVKCPHCGEWQDLDYFVNVCREKKAFICRKCRGVLDDEARMKGEWVAEYPGREWSGYHISQLIAPWITAAEILEQEQTKSQEYFYNFVLGLPVIGGANSVSRTIILQNCTQDMPKQPRFNLLGVDVGKVLHCVQGNEWGITKVFTLPDWDSLEKYFRQQGINLCVVDNAPDTEEAARFVKRHPGRAYRAIYDYDDKRKEAVEFIERGEKSGIVRIHRTRAIDALIETYERSEVSVFLKPNDPQLVGKQKAGVIENCLCDHWETLYIIGEDGVDKNLVKKDKMGNVIRTWENAGPDHFVHANVYFEVARQKKLPAANMPEDLPRSVPRSRLSSYTGY